MQDHQVTYQNASSIIELDRERDFFLTPNVGFTQSVLDFDRRNKEAWHSRFPLPSFYHMHCECLTDSYFCWFLPTLCHFYSATAHFIVMMLYYLCHAVFFYPIGGALIIYDTYKGCEAWYANPHEIKIRILYIGCRILFPAFKDVIDKPFQYMTVTSTAGFFFFFENGSYMWIFHTLREIYNWYSLILILNNDASIFIQDIELHFDEAIEYVFLAQFPVLSTLIQDESDEEVEMFHSAPEITNYILYVSESDDDDIEILPFEEAPVATEIIYCESSASELSSSSSSEEIPRSLE
jgi:hypothetical protein